MEEFLQSPQPGLFQVSQNNGDHRSAALGQRNLRRQELSHVIIGSVPRLRQLFLLLREQHRRETAAGVASGVS